MMKGLKYFWKALTVVIYVLYMLITKREALIAIQYLNFETCSVRTFLSSKNINKDVRARLMRKLPEAFEQSVVAENNGANHG